VSYLRELGADLRRIGARGLDMLVLSMATAIALSVTAYHVAPFVNRHLGPALGRLLPAAFPAGNLILAMLVRAAVILVIPLASLAIIRVPVGELGFALGNPRKWLLDIGIAYLVMLPLVYLAARQPSFQRTYPYFDPARYGMTFFWLGLAARLIFMFAWEFLFRGYLLFGFGRTVGLPAAIAIQTIPFVVMHFGKPSLETYGSIIAAVVLGIIAMRAKSFLPCAILHFSVAATLDLVAVFVVR